LIVLYSLWINNMADDLKFPRLEREPLPPPLRTMDEIDAWIEENCRLFMDRKIYEAEKIRNAVNVPFRLR